MTKTTEKAAPFRFKKFSVAQDRCSMPVNSDGVLLGAWVNAAGTERALDIGTGTGVIALMLAQRLPEARIDAVEIDEAAARQARENMAASDFAKRLRCVHESIQDFSRFAEHDYDLIVSNPPFFTGGTMSDNQDRSGVRHTVKLPHGDLIQAVRRLLKPGGRLAVILPHIEGLRFVEMATTYGLHARRQTDLYPRAGRPVERILVEFSKAEGPLERDELVMYAGEKSKRYTEAYRRLTADFYL